MVAVASQPGWRHALAARWRGRLAALARPRASESLPVTLDRRRIYILPTKFGLFIGVLLAAMLMGALNYNNNPALLLGFLLAAAAQLSLHMTHLALSGIRLLELRSAPVHAGDPAVVQLRIDATRARPRQGLVLECAGARSVFSLPDADPITVELSIPTTQRGWLRPGRIKLSTTQPLGMARAWSWFWPDARVLVYPRPEARSPPLPAHDGPGARTRVRAQGDEPHHLRDYHVGDPPKQVAWKPSARVGKLLVREYETRSDRELRLEWSSLLAMPYEARIARLARWVIEADRIGARFALVIPNQLVGPAQGHAHRQACLQALALLPIADATSAWS
ncbi:MAG: DUF58 domain-containing protein [Lysobacteraceae bacterium]